LLHFLATPNSNPDLSRFLFNKIQIHVLLPKIILFVKFIFNTFGYTLNVRLSRIPPVDKASCDALFFLFFSPINEANDLFLTNIKSTINIRIQFQIKEIAL